MEAFSDGVMAIVITIMVLELRPPSGDTLAALRPLIPVFVSYTLSFIFLGIYWNNHHHLLQAVQRVNGGVLWANLHLLFWLSLVPFATAWMGENNFSAWPVAVYSSLLLFAALAYLILTRVLITVNGQDSVLAKAVGGETKGKISTALYVLAIPMAFINSWLAYALLILVAVIWLVPDRRIERTLSS
jgi:uncharacterized membrane protein